MNQPFSPISPPCNEDFAEIWTCEEISGGKSSDESDMLNFELDSLLPETLAPLPPPPNSIPFFGEENADSHYISDIEREKELFKIQKIKQEMSLFAFHQALNDFRDRFELSTIDLKNRINEAKSRHNLMAKRLRVARHLIDADRVTLEREKKIFIADRYRFELEKKIFLNSVSSKIE
jgi:hypothetical protein